MKRTQKYPDTNTFHYYNANPKNRITGDCWLRAICTGLEEDYNDVLMEMVKAHIETGYELSCDKAVDRYLASKGWVKHNQPRKPDNTKYTGSEFCEMVNRYSTGGNIIANIGGHHMVAIKPANGKYKVHDIWNSTRKCIGNYWTKG